MYEFPSDFDYKNLVGKSLEMVCFNSIQMYLHFSEGIFITINGAFSHYILGDERQLKMPTFYPEFIHLCERKVTDAYLEKKTDLCIVFENNEKICFHGDTHYESYEINKNGKRIII